MTPQSRGQQFNELLAELLRYWRLEGTESDVHGAGEIDVALAADGHAVGRPSAIGLMRAAARAKSPLTDHLA
jgi:hypothetical protein